MATRNDKTLCGRLLEAPRDKLLIKMARQLMEIDDRLTNFKLRSHRDNATADKQGNDEANPKATI